MWIQQGITPAKIQVDTGIKDEKTVQVALQLEGYPTKKGRLTLRAGEAFPWHVTLDAVPAPRLPEREQPLTPEREAPLKPPGSRTITGKDGAEMVWIAGGTFEMGSNDGFSDEKPVHTVTVDGFYMDVHEVTNVQYRRFVQETGHREPEGYEDVNGEWVGNFKPWEDSRFSGDNQPVVCVSWHDAMAYAQWVGKRLPTEAEWEYAARGGLEGKKYPWGNEAPDGTQCNFADKHADFSWSDKSVDDGYQYTAPVKSYLPNRYGLYDMVGNVWEWCLDEYRDNFYSQSPQANPIAGGNTSNVITNSTSVETSRALRGGSWSDLSLNFRVANRGRFEPINGFYSLGFRCVSAR